MTTTLIGSEKQIEWATAIRADILASEPEVSAMLDQCQAQIDAGTAPAHLPARVQAMREALDTIKAEARAGWWIDQRGVKLYVLMTTPNQFATR